MRYVKVLLWVTVVVVVLTAAQYGSIHLLTGRPSSWLFEASLDVAPPLLFFGDMVQLYFNRGSQAPMRDQPVALTAGVLANVFLYGFAAVVVTWLFIPGNRTRATVSGASRRR